jgi:hypothetical protein
MMNSVNELLKLFMRQAKLESAMRQPGGARGGQSDRAVTGKGMDCARLAPRGRRMA